MNVQASILSVASAVGVSTRNLYLQHKPAAQKLALLLPGRDYTCDRPALYYLRQLALRRGFDVLCMQYGSQVTDAPTAWDTAATQALEEAGQALQQALAGRLYREILFIGKSMGTPIALEMAAKLDLPTRSAILLTPVGKGFGPFGGLRALAVLGTKDRTYGTTEHREAAGRADAQWLELDGVGHNLDHAAGWAPSLAALQRVLEAAEEFLSGNAG